MRDPGQRAARAAALGGAVTLIFVVGCTRLDRVPDGDVDASQRAAAERIATKIYESCNTGKIEPLSDSEASSQMRASMTVDKQRASCDGIKKTFGDYASMDYVETYKAKGTGLYVYRFKGHFSRTSETPEIRVVMDGDKLSGFWLKPWTDTPR